MPCAGYSGFVIEPCSGRLWNREEPRYAMHAPTNCQPFGRSDRTVAALSAVAICDAMRIGFLSGVAENPSARGKTSRGECLKRCGKSRARESSRC